MAARHIKGRDTLCQVLISGTPVDTLDVMSWSIEPYGTTIDDGVCGEGRTRKDKVTDGYKITMRCFNQTMRKLAQILNYDLSADAPTKLDSVDFGFKVSDTVGGQDIFTASGVTIDFWKLDLGGKNERGMLDIPMRADEFALAT